MKRGGGGSVSLEIFWSEQVSLLRNEVAAKTLPTTGRVHAKGMCGNFFTIQIYRDKGGVGGGFGYIRRYSCANPSERMVLSVSNPVSDMAELKSQQEPPRPVARSPSENAFGHEKPIYGNIQVRPYATCSVYPPTGQGDFPQTASSGGYGRCRDWCVRESCPAFNSDPVFVQRQEWSVSIPLRHPFPCTPAATR